MQTEQRIVVFEGKFEKTGVFSGTRVSNAQEINALLADGWRVVMMSPTSSPSTNVGIISEVFALVVLERPRP